MDPEGIEGNHFEVNQTSLEMATSLAASESAELHIISAWHPFIIEKAKRQLSETELQGYMDQQRRYVEERLDRIIAPFLGSCPSIEVHLEKGAPVTVIEPRLVKQLQLDLVVMGNLARTGVAGHLMGNTAEQVLDSIHCDILTMKAKDFRTPVH